jgi:LysR family transcriptional regulator for bpeEF and oprC
MGLLDSVEFLTTAVEAGSFAAAARRLGVTPSAVSRRISGLERELGVRLLARTTRSLRLTHDGEAFHLHCLRALSELHEARDAIARASKKPSGLLRVDVPFALGRQVIAPAMGRFLDRYPAVRLDLTLHDRFVDPVVEGLDVLIRIGRLADSPLVARKLAESRIVYCASPAYLRKHGSPKTPRALSRHKCLGYLREGFPSPFQFATNDGMQAIDVVGPFNANDAEVLRELALAGHGIVGLFDFLLEGAIERGALVPVLEAHPSIHWPIHALYPQNRHLLPKVRVFLDFMATLFARRA